LDVEQLADLSRRYIDRLVTTKAPPDVLERVASLVGAATDELAAHVPDAPRNMYEGFDGSGELDAYLELFRLNPVIGRLNPVAPRFDLEIRADGAGLEGAEVIARTTLGLLYEGPAGMVHGGIIASLFDQFLSLANIHNGFGAFTGTLTIRYRRPCPLETPLEFRCRTDRTDGRKVFAVGELLAAGALVAEAAGTFIEPSEHRRAELIEEKQRLVGPDDHA
jgi:acyl-coenzyme A thioesterase PaaI-like protein